jgi:hypothetical protein
MSSGLVDLDAEMTAAFGRLDAAHARRLDALGVPRALIMGGMVGLGQVRIAGDFYEPDEHGGGVYVTPIRVHGETPESPDPASTLARGILADLVAWRPDRPGCWRTRCGAVSWLGAIEPQYSCPLPVSLWRDPLNWLRAGARGLVVLTDSLIDRWHLLNACRGGIEAEDRSHAAEIRAALAHPFPAPAVWARRAEGARRAAA